MTNERLSRYDTEMPSCGSMVVKDSRRFSVRRLTRPTAGGFFRHWGSLPDLHPRKHFQFEDDASFHGRFAGLCVAGVRVGRTSEMPVAQSSASSAEKFHFLPVVGQYLAEEFSAFGIKYHCSARYVDNQSSSPSLPKLRPPEPSFHRCRAKMMWRLYLRGSRVHMLRLPRRMMWPPRPPSPPSGPPFGTYLAR